MPQITLKRDWDFTSTISPNSVIASPHFQGRQRITAMVANEIVRRQRGSILISGQRGVGKSEIVHKALAVAMDKNPTEKWLIVPVNASQFEDADSDVNPTSDKNAISNVTPRRILCTLIRGLFRAAEANTAMDVEIRGDISDLYEKAIAQAWSRTTDSALESSLQTLSRTTRDLTLQLKSNAIAALLAGAVATSVALGLAKTGLTAWVTGTLSTLASAATFVGAPLAIRYFYERNDSSKQTTAVKRTSVLDNSVNNLEYDLETAQKAIAKTYRIIYVIDEMDKLVASNVIKALKYFKLLLTGSDATFIFITETQLYDTACQTHAKQDIMHGKSRPEEYTLFSSKFYIDRPRTDEAMSFLNSIVDKMDKDGIVYWMQLQRSLLFNSNHDFFDLKTQIQNRVTNFDSNEQPVLLNPVKIDDIKFAKFQKVISIMLEGRYLGEHPLTWRTNEELWLTAFQHAKSVCDGHVGDVLHDSQERTVTNELKKDLNQLLYRSGALAPHIVDNNHRHNNQPQPLSWKITGSIEEPPDRLDQPTTYEREYVNYFNELVEFAAALHNASAIFNKSKTIDTNYLKTSGDKVLGDISSLGFNFRGLVDEHQANINAIFGNTDARLNREATIERCKRLAQGIQSFKNSSPAILLKFLVSNFPQKAFRETNFFTNHEVFNDAAKPIRNALERSYNSSPIYTTSDNSRQIIFLHNQTETLQKISAELKENIATHRVVLSADFDARLAPDSVVTIDLSSPENFKNDLINFLDTIREFINPRRRLKK